MSELIEGQEPKKLVNPIIVCPHCSMPLENVGSRGISMSPDVSMVIFFHANDTCQRALSVQAVPVPRQQRVELANGLIVPGVN